MKDKAPHRRSLPAHEAAVVALLLTLLAMFSLADWLTLARHDGVDFCQFWSVTKAREASGGQLGSPYRNSDAYLQQIDQTQFAGGDQALHRAIHSRPMLDLTGSPLLYTAFEPLPGRYSESLRWFRCAQVAAFLLAVGLLLRWAAFAPKTSGTWFALALLLAYDPLIFDLQVGNVNSFQLLGLAVAVLLVSGLRGSQNLRETLLAAAVAALLAVLLLLKPNLGAALMMLGLSTLLRTSMAGRLAAIAAAVAAAAAGIAVAAEAFDSWTVWADWWELTFRSVGRLSYPLDSGNQSVSLYLAHEFGETTEDSMRALAAAWIISLAAAFAGPLRSTQHPAQLGCQCLGALLRDPGCAVGIGVLTMFALSPLSWPHYYVLGLLPVFWLLRDEPAWSAQRVMAWCGLLLMAGLPRRVYTISGGFSDDLMFALRVLAWTPLWLGVLLKLGRNSHSEAEAAPAAA